MIKKYFLIKTLQGFQICKNGSESIIKDFIVYGQIGYVNDKKYWNQEYLALDYFIDFVLSIYNFFGIANLKYLLGEF